MGKKYELTDETIQLDSPFIGFQPKILHRIRYVDGTPGGWIESYDNLSQDGLCAVLDEAQVFDGARISGNAVVSGSSRVRGENCKVYGCAAISGEARLGGNVQIFDAAQVSGKANLWSFCPGYVLVYGQSYISGKAEIRCKDEFINARKKLERQKGSLIVGWNRRIEDESSVRIFDSARVYGKCKVSSGVNIFDYAEVFGDAELEDEDVFGHRRVGGSFSHEPSASSLPPRIAYEPRPPMRYGSGSYRSPAASFMEDMERARQAAENARWLRGLSEGMD